MFDFMGWDRALSDRAAAPTYARFVPRRVDGGGELPTRRVAHEAGARRRGAEVSRRSRATAAGELELPPPEDRAVGSGAHRPIRGYARVLGGRDVARRDGSLLSADRDGGHPGAVSTAQRGMSGGAVP